MKRREYILLIEDDAVVAEGIALLLERPGRTTIYCSDIESAEIVLDRYPVTHILSDVHLSEPLGFEGLRFLKHVRDRRPSSSIVLMSGDKTDSLSAAASAMGALTVLAKPFTAEELASAISTHTAEDGDYELLQVPPIEDVLQTGMVKSVFQPIVSLTEPGAPFGFEALMRTIRPWPAGGTADLFDYAMRVERLADLNLAGLRNAVSSGAQLSPDSALFINLDPIVFESESVTSELRTAAAGAGIELSRIVLEITERSHFSASGRADRTFGELRGHGVRFALDDHASAYSHLARFDVIRPSFIKIGGGFGLDLERDETRMKIVSSVVHLARDLGCRTVLEGVESAATAHVARTLGIDLAQGYHFGRPETAEHWSETRAA